MICRYNFFASRIPIARTHAASRQNGSTGAFVPALHTLSRLNGLSDYGDGFVGWGKPADESPMSALTQSGHKTISARRTGLRQSNPKTGTPLVSRGGR